jgi:transcriptional regulator with XRE-family HTH domain
MASPKYVTPAREEVSPSVRVLSQKKRPKRLPEKLLEIRTELGLSQGGMSRRLGGEESERAYVSKFERGVLVPPLHVLLAYAEAANVLVEVLIKDSLDLPSELPSRAKHEGVARAISSSRRHRR